RPGGPDSVVDSESQRKLPINLDLRLIRSRSNRIIRVTDHPRLRKERPMITIKDGQCGLCRHFGEHDEQREQQLVQIRTSKSAPETFKEECGHPMHEPLHLVVTANSGCEGFEPAVAA